MRHFAGAGRPDLTLKFSAIAAAVNIILNVALVPHLGILGAAVATSVTAISGVILFLIYMPKIFSTNLDLSWYAKLLSITFSAIVLFVIAAEFFNMSIVGGVILAVYVIFIVKFFLKEEDRKLILSTIYSAVPRFTH